MPRLIFVNRYFFPDHSATSQILSDLAFHLAAAGRDVHVITSRQIYDDPQASLPEHDVIDGVTLHRVASTRFGRAALAGRAVDYLSFYRSIRRRLAALARPGDIVIAKTDPPLASVVAMGATARAGARLINWLQDIYPETAAELGVPLLRGPVAAGLAALRDRSLHKAVATVVPGELMAGTIARRGVAPKHIHVIANWCDDEAITPCPPAENPLRQSWGLADKFVLGYSGNLGRAHEFDTVLAAAEKLRDEPRLVFLMIGGGKRFDELQTIVRSRGLGGAFRFMPYQARNALRHSLGVPDVHWLSLDPKLEGLIVPSKFYGIAAAGRPIVMVGDPNGELGRLVRANGCGFAVTPGDAAALIAALQQLMYQPDTLADMGRRARAMLDATFSRRQSLQAWAGLIDRLLSERPSSAG
jgi:glycosyltransferase involved in cell wall biosynthesis